MKPISEVYNCDCMEYMRSVPDKFFDLAIVDPPYGIKNGSNATSRLKKSGNLLLENDYKPDKYILKNYSEYLKTK